MMLHLRAYFSFCARYVFSLAIICFSLSTQPAHALIIGEIEIGSRAGEPLLAYVPLSPENPDEKITPACLSLLKSGISPEQERTDLSTARLELEGSEDIGQRVRISTSAPVNARSLTLQLKANCVPHGLVIREFDFELEPAPTPLLPQPESASALGEKVDERAAQQAGEKGASQKLDLSGSVRAGYFSSSRKLDGEKDLGSGSVWLKGAKNFGENTSLVAQGWVRNDESFRAGGASEKLQEGYLQFSSGNVDYRIGKQIIVWGRADRLNPTDNLTPRNYTLLTPEDDDQRLGSWAAKMTYFSQDGALTGIWLPDFDPNVIPVPPTPGTFMTEQIPHANQFALKFDRSGDDVDWSASYFDGLDLNPDFAIGATTPLGTNLILEHNYIRVLGADAATVMGRYGLRAEAAYTWTENAGENDFVIKKPFFYMVMGGDRTFFDYLNVNLQYYLRYVTNYSDPQLIADPLLRSVAIEAAALSNQYERSQNGVSIRVSDKWLNETLEGEIAAVAAFGRSDYAIRPKLVYAFTDNIKGSFGLDIYRGDSNTLFGLLRPSSLLYAEMKYCF
ncbi:MAG: hypothetical protein ACLQHK_07690 [Gallionellaceae bacterium]